MKTLGVVGVINLRKIIKLNIYPDALEIFHDFQKSIFCNYWEIPIDNTGTRVFLEDYTGARDIVPAI